MACSSGYCPPKRSPVGNLLLLSALGILLLIVSINLFINLSILGGLTALSGAAIFFYAVGSDLLSHKPSTLVELLPEEVTSEALSSKNSTLATGIKKNLSQPNTVFQHTKELSRQAFGKTLTGIGWFLILLGASTLYLLIKPSQLDDGPQIDFGPAGKLTVIVISILAPLGGIALVVFGRKLGSPRASRLLSDDNRPPILILRSFNDDEIQLPKPRPKKSTSYEQLFFSLLPSQNDHNTLENSLASCFQIVGPVIALGTPGEKLAPTGAARTWYPHEDWKQRVEELVAWAQRVVLIVGDVQRHGLDWEVRHILTNALPRKIVLVMPPHVSQQDIEQRWQFLREVTSDRIPPYRSGTVIIYFPTNSGVNRLRHGVG